MPWQIDGTFLRVTNNTTADPNGDLWNKDFAASIKIIATRHDVHDQDLADGIASCLNLDGLNTMRAILKMGGYKITDVGQATVVNDVPRYGQCAGTTDFNPGTRLFTLLDRDGNLIDGVTIPSGTGGGGEGTVSEINVGPGLVSTQNPITTIANLDLAELGIQQTYSGGIQGMTVDVHGRVIQVDEGASANTNLGNNRSSNSVEITSSTGSNTSILEATNSLAGVMSANQAQQLADLVAAGVTGMTPPTELNGIVTEPQLTIMQGAEKLCDSLLSSVSTGAAGWNVLLAETGAGILEFLTVTLAATAFSPGIGLRLLIDGIVVWTDSDFYPLGNVQTVDSGVSIVGGTDVGLTFAQIPFNQSFSLQWNTGTASQQMETWYRYTKI